VTKGVDILITHHFGGADEKQVFVSAAADTAKRNAA